MCAYFAAVTFVAAICAANTVDARELNPAKYYSGIFTILYDPGANSLLRIYDNSSSLVWFSASAAGHKNFVSAAKVNETVYQNGGVYVVDNDVLDICREMTIAEHESVAEHGASNAIVFKGTICKDTNFSLSFQSVDVVDGDTIRYHLQLNLSILENSPYNQIWLTYGSEEDEHFYGFGHQYTKFDMKGQRLPLFLSEQGVGRGLEPLTLLLDASSKGAGGNWHTTYTRVPFYLSSHNRGFLLQSPQYAVFDMTDCTVVRLELNSRVLMARIIPGQSAKEIVTSLTAYTGRMAALPDWLDKGAVVGMQGGTDVVLQVLSQIKETVGSSDDVAGFWLQDWTGQRNFTSSSKDIGRVGLWWNWEVDAAHYPRWEGLIQQLQEQENISVLTYINALLTDVSKRGTPYQHNYWQEAIDNGYFVKNSSGDVWVGYTAASLVDLSNPSAYDWYKKIIIQNMAATGVKGWMCDFGESVPLDAKLWQGTGTEWHTHYPEVWGRINQEAIAEATKYGLKDGKDIVYFMRSGATFSPALTSLFWLGDQTVTWDIHDGLATIMVGLLSSGLSGYSLQHSDIGGYTALELGPLKYLRSKELLMRWSELAAFTAMYRSHLGTLPAGNWQFNSDKETMVHYFKMARLYKSLSTYRRTLMVEAEEKGLPLARPMFMEYPTEPATVDLVTQFMFGSEMLVAPVLKAGVSAVKIFLPNNTNWVNIWSNKQYQGQGGSVTIAAPMGQPCALVRNGSAVAEQIKSQMYKYGLLPLDNEAMCVAAKWPWLDQCGEH